MRHFIEKKEVDYAGVRVKPGGREDAIAPQDIIQIAGRVS
jgi:hypothetical protein